MVVSVMMIKPSKFFLVSILGICSILINSCREGESPDAPYATLTEKFKLESQETVWVLFHAQSQLPSELLSPVVVMFKESSNLKLLFSSADDSYAVESESGKILYARRGDVVIEQDDQLKKVGIITEKTLSWRELKSQIDRFLKEVNSVRDTDDTSRFDHDKKPPSGSPNHPQ